MIQKYRAWDKTNKKLGLVDGGILNGEFDHLKIFDEDEDDWQSVENFIIMQSTGQFDSSEPPKEIFKDDIVTTTRFTGNSYKTYTGVVKQLEGCWVIDTGNDAVQLWTEIEENIVLGNIHQHPFLLEGKRRIKI